MKSEFIAGFKVALERAAQFVEASGGSHELAEKLMCLSVDDNDTTTNIDESFKEFWEAMPKREGNNPRKTARSAYERIVKRKIATVDELLRGAERYTASSSRTEPRFIRMAATWLNQECWKDAVFTAIPSGSGGLFDVRRELAGGM